MSVNQCKDGLSDATAAPDAVRDLIAGFGNQTTLLDIKAVGAKLIDHADADLNSLRVAKEISERPGLTWNKSEIAKALKTGLDDAKKKQAEQAKQDKIKAKLKHKATDQDDGNWLPSGFKRRDGEIDGAWLYRVHGDDGEYEDRICKAFSPMAICRDAGGGNLSLLVMVALNGKPTPVRIPLAEMTGNANAGLNALSVSSLPIMPGQEKWFLTLMGEALANAKTEIETADRPGWKCPDESGCPTIFVLPDGSNIERGKPLPAPDERRQPRVFLTAPLVNQVAGSWDGYRAAMHACWQSGLAHFQAAPLSIMTGVLGGFCDMPTMIFSNTGPSTAGKSTALKIKAAAIGNPQNKAGPYRTAKSTANATERSLAEANHTGVCLDEIGLLDGSLEDFIMMAAEGSGKDRARANMTTRKSFEWCTSIHLAGEHSVDEMLRGYAKAKGRKVRVGATVRCIDIPVVKRQLPDEIMRPIVTALPEDGRQGHYGHLVRHFVHQLFEDNESPDAVAARIEAKARKLAAGGDLIQLRVARTFATVWECGDILKRFDGLPADADVESFIRSLWSGFIKGETARNLDSAGAAIEDLRSYLVKSYALHGQNVDQKGTAPRGEIKFYYRAKSSDAEVWILKQDLAALLAEASSLTANEGDVLRKLADAGILQRQQKDRMVCKYIPAVGYFTSYHLIFADMDLSSEQPLPEDEKKAATTATDRAEAEAAAERQREEAAATATAEREAQKKMWRERADALKTAGLKPYRKRVFT